MDTLKEQGYKVNLAGLLRTISLLWVILFQMPLTGVWACDHYWQRRYRKIRTSAIEALLTLDPDAATPWLVVERGTGRHVKDGVRIGVAQMGLTTYVSLPGPHDEVIAATAIRTLSV